MLDYLNEVNLCIGRVFSHWSVFGLFVPVLVAVVTGFLVTNAVTFRDQRRRAYDEVVFLRRRLYFTRENPPTKPKTSADWEKIFLDFDYELTMLVREMKNTGFLISARILEREIEKVRNRFVQIYKETEMKIGEPVGQVAEKYNSDFDGEVRRRLHLYFMYEHEVFVRGVCHLKPPVFELLNAPTFARWFRRKLASE